MRLRTKKGTAHRARAHVDGVSDSLPNWVLARLPSLRRPRSGRRPAFESKDLKFCHQVDSSKRERTKEIRPREGVLSRHSDRIRTTKSSHKSGKTSGSDPTVHGEDGMLADIEVQPLVAVAESKSDPTADIKKFFGAPSMMKGKRSPALKLHRKCITCGPYFGSIPSCSEYLVAEITTNRRHMAKHAFSRWGKLLASRGLSPSQAKPSPPQRLGLRLEESEAKARGFQAQAGASKSSQAVTSLVSILHFDFDRRDEGQDGAHASTFMFFLSLVLVMKRLPHRRSGPLVSIPEESGTIAGGGGGCRIGLGSSGDFSEISFKLPIPRRPQAASRRGGCPAQGGAERGGEGLWHLASALMSRQFVQW
ncbi:hypothetical protein DFH08DRAFT_940146 [Mycena albidolilacea]|uniref:Uncharacterized protein n=1 Tax=Mycena albidolilacea TaxID=1033008 RepID=A0AAD6ZND0_9AGAR|nr:hypothetical protein DFH08DRAFT_940146 [Mycena albidolilacea]